MRELAERANSAMQLSGKAIALANYAGYHTYQEFAERGGNLYGKQVKKWYCLGAADIAQIKQILEKNGF